MRYLSLAVVFAAALALLAPCVSATVYTIHPDGTGDFPTISQALHAARDGDVIELEDGIFRGPGNRHLAFVGKAITIRSRSGDPSRCVIDCEGSDGNEVRGFMFDAGETSTSVLAHLTIMNGYMCPG